MDESEKDWSVVTFGDLMGHHDHSVKIFDYAKDWPGECIDGHRLARVSLYCVDCSVTFVVRTIHASDFKVIMENET